MQLVRQHPGATPNAPDSSTVFSEFVEDYLSQYVARDNTRRYQLAWWANYFGDRPFTTITDDEIQIALERLPIRSRLNLCQRVASNRRTHA